MIIAQQIYYKAGLLHGQDIATIGQRSTFKVDVVGESFIFEPASSKKPRRMPRKKAEEVLALYSSTRSKSCATYQAVTQNASYFLSLIRETETSAN